MWDNFESSLVQVGLWGEFDGYQNNPDKDYFKSLAEPTREELAKTDKSFESQRTKTFYLIQ